MGWSVDYVAIPPRGKTDKKNGHPAHRCVLERYQQSAAESIGKAACGLAASPSATPQAAYFFRKCSKNATSCSLDSAVGVWPLRLVMATRFSTPSSLFTATRWLRATQRSG